MSDISFLKIEVEFRRHVYLCQGLGLSRMKQIIEEVEKQGDPQWYVCPACAHTASFCRGHTCTSAPPMRVESIDGDPPNRGG